MADHKLGSAATLLQNGEMRRLEVDGTAILLARVIGDYHAVAADCTHYGGPLNEGVLCGHQVMCPWHHACFDIRSGTRLEPPALNDLAHYPVTIKDGEVIVSLTADNESEPQGKSEPADDRHFVIIGGGAAGNSAAEQLRREGYRGKITMISQVSSVPVDRPNLSKDYLAGKAEPSWIPLRPDPSWYAERDIRLLLDTAVMGIDPLARRVTLANSAPIRYDKLLLATGGIPRQLRDVPGTDLAGVYTLRTLADADQIIAATEGAKRAVIIGASFIAMEAAASLLGGRGIAVTVVGIEAIPFERLFGAEIGKAFQQEHERNGVKFRLNAGVNRFLGEDGRVTGVELKSGEVLPADFVLVGVGVQPATDFLQSSGLRLHDRDKSVRVSASLQTSDPDIYAAGDIARIDNGTPGGVRIEHWRVALQHGMIAARSMLGNADSADQHIPFFWTNQWDIIFDYVGYAEKWDEIIYRYGKPADKNFLAFYVADGKLLAAAGMQRDTELDAIEFILRDAKPLTVDQMRDEKFDLVKYAQKR
ncbi:MAG: FAD-dependent oxidoreductase [Anaerolineae bacterium]